MKKFLSLVMVLALMLGALTVLTSCGEPEDDGAVISVYLGEGVYDLDPSDYFVSDNAAALMSLVYEPLFYLDEDGDLEFAAADDYEVDEDKREITINIRETYWSDNSNRVKAEDFIYAWRNVILNPHNANPAAPLLYDIENAIEVKRGIKSIDTLGVSAVDVYDLVIKYREGADYEQLLKNLASVATAPVREAVAQLAPGHWSKSADTIVTNGAFSVKSINYATDEDATAGALILERNKGYHQSPAAEDFMEYVLPYQLVSSFSVGEKKVNITYDSLVNKTVFYMGDATLADRLAHKDDAVVADLASTYTFAMNTELDLFKNKDVRRALSLALDRNEIKNAVVFGEAATALLPEVSAETLGGQQNLISTSAKVEEAKALLAGYNGDKSFRLMVGDDEESRKIAELAIAKWTEVGFTVIPVYVSEAKDANGNSLTVYDTVSGKDIVARESALQYYIKGAVQNGNYDAFDVIGFDMQTYSTDGFAALAQFSSELNGNGAHFDGDKNERKVRATFTGWHSDAYDKLIEDAYNTDDSDVKADKLRQAEKMLIDEAVIVPVLFNQSFAFVHGDLDDVMVDGLGHFILTEADLDNYQEYNKKED